MSAECGLCTRPLPAGYLCQRDTVALATRLAELPDLDAELTMHLVPARTGPAQLVATRSAAGPRAPINLAVFDELRDNRAAEVVHSWRVDVQRERWPQHSAPPPGGLAADCRWLGMELGWIAAEYPAAGELAREVRDLEAQLRSLVGDPVPRRQRLGLCVASTDAEGGVCGAVISRLPSETRLVCRMCGCVYEARDFLTLGHFQPRAPAPTPGGADAPEARPSRA
ncbi:hypothetical protein [Streptomyces sp. NPDC059759]|uniref:hypothetical protein n=1 Tax=Streptomyces sp. NPDC059759 TaxID=3346936 RepID=UPI0036656433